MLPRVSVLPRAKMVAPVAKVAATDSESTAAAGGRHTRNSEGSGRALSGVGAVADAEAQALVRRGQLGDPLCGDRASGTCSSLLPWSQQGARQREVAARQPGAVPAERKAAAKARPIMKTSRPSEPRSTVANSTTLATLGFPEPPYPQR